MLTISFAPEELIARIKALTRRKGEVVLDETSYGDFNFNASTNQLSKGIKSVHLNFKEAEILKLFLSKPEVIISKEEIITKVWGYESDAGSNSARKDMTISRLSLILLFRFPLIKREIF